MACLRKFERSREKIENGIEKTPFPASAISLCVEYILQNASVSRLGNNDRLFVFSLKNAVEGSIIVRPQQTEGGLENCQNCISQKYTLPCHWNAFVMERIIALTVFPLQNSFVR